MDNTKRLRIIKVKAAAKLKLLLLMDIEPEQTIIPSKTAKVIDMPVKSISTDEKRFQNRANSFSSESKERIVKAVENKTFDWAKFDPIIIWLDPKMQIYFVLSGHSRLSAFKQLASTNKNFKDIPVKIFKGTEAQAIDLALNSNTLSTKETEVERAMYYSKKRNVCEISKSVGLLGGLTECEKLVETECKEAEGKNSNYILNLSYLNRDGFLIESLNKLGIEKDNDSTNVLRTIANWIGEARRNNQQLSNIHETEIAKFLLNGGYGNKTGQFKNKTQFNERLKYSFDKWKAQGADETRPLNLANTLSKSSFEKDFDSRLAKAKTEMDQAIAEHQEKHTKYLFALMEKKIDQKRYDELMKPVITNMQWHNKEYERIMGQKYEVKKAASAQTSLFGLEILPITNPEELPYKLAYEAHRGTSFSPEVRAKSHQQDYAETLNQYAETFEKLIKSDAQKEIAISEFERFKQKYTSLYHAWLSAKSRCLSTMITGPSNFPVRKAEKANDAEHKRSTELSEFEDKAVNAIIKKIKGLLPEETRNDEAWISIKKDVYHSIATVVGIHRGELHYNKPLITGALKRRITTLYKNNQHVNVNKALEEISEAEKKYNLVIFAKNNPIWDLRKEPEIIEVEKKENKSIFKNNDLEVLNNYEIDRLQLLFDGKPSQEIINYLKSKAFKWSPSNMAWQRQLTNNAIYDVKAFLDKFYKDDLTNRLRINKAKAAAKIKLLQLLGINNLEGLSFNYLKSLKQFFANAFKGNFIEITMPKSFLLKNNFPDNVIGIRSSVLAKKIKDHSFTYNDLKHLDTYINNPLMLFKSYKIKGAFVIIVEKSNNEGLLCCAIHPDQKINKMIVNEIASIHGRDLDQLINWVQNNYLLDFQIKKVEKVFSDSGFNSPKSKYLLNLLAQK